MNVVVALIAFLCGMSLDGWCVAAAAVQDPIPNRMSPRLESILASVQARAAQQMVEQRQKSTQAETPSQAPKMLDAALSAPVTKDLRDRSVHVHAPTVDDRVQDMLNTRTPAADPVVPQAVPQFLIRADGRPIGSGSFVGDDKKQGVKVKQLRGALKIDGDYEDVPQFKIYFEGMETTNTAEGFYSFPIEETSIRKYAIIVCNKIKHSFGKHNTVEGFGLIPDMNYKYFRFRQNADGSGSWVQREKDLRKKNLQVPSNAIVIPVNPAYFARLDVEWPGKFERGVLKLPRIVLKSDARAKIKRKAEKSLLYGLDMSPFHTNVAHASKEIGDARGEVLIDHAR